jgi:hypothetical protein
VYSRGIDIQFPNISAGFVSPLLFGFNHDTNNQGVIDFGYAGNNSTNNYVGIGFYANDNIFTVYANKNAELAGKFTATYNGAQSYAVVNAVSTYNGEWARGMDVTFLNQPTGTYCSGYLFGKVDGTNNKGVLAFYYADNQSTNNAITIGLYANDHIMCIKGTRNVGIDTESPAYKLHVNGTMYASNDVISDGNVTTTSIELNARGTLSGYGGFIDFHYNGSSADFTSRIIEDASGRLYLNAVNGVRIGDAVLRWESSNNALRVELATGGAVNLYTTGGLSALGISGAVDGTVNASLIPSATGTYTLGNTNYRWKELYLADANGHNGKIYSDYDGINLDSVNGGYFDGNRYIITGRLAVGTPDDDQPNYDLYVAGNTYVDGTNAYFYGNVSVQSLTQRSDMRIKDVISDMTLKINTVAQAPLFKYKLKQGDGTIMVGSSAQYWDALLPEVIHRDAEGILGLDYGVTALASVISVAKEVTEHERRIARLEAENAILRAQIEDLKAA